jgi:hypothetical protein
MVASYHHFIAVLLLLQPDQVCGYACSHTNLSISSDSEIGFQVRLASPCHKAASLLQIADVQVAGVRKETENYSQLSTVLMRVSNLMPLMLVLAMCGMPQLLCSSEFFLETEKPNQDMPKTLPAISSLRYLAVVIIWFGHEYLHFFETSPLFAMISGFVLQFAEERRNHDEMDLRAKCRFFYRRFMRLYPIFALHVVAGNMAGLPWTPGGGHEPCPAWSWLSLGAFEPTLSCCGSGTWFIPMIIGCYAMFPWSSQYLRRLSIKSLLLLLACSLLLAGTQGKFQHTNLSFVMARFFIGMIMVPIWMKISRYPAYRVFSALACNPGLCILIWWIFREESVLWPPTWFEVLLLLGVAGICDNNVETTFTENPVLFCLSRPQLAWMGELALPLYMTNTLFTSFIDRNMQPLHVSCLKHDGLNGKPWKWENDDLGNLFKCPGQEVAFLAATEFVVIHAAALLIYSSCAR